MKRSGCSSLNFGLESGSPRVIKLMRKNFDLNVAKRVIRDAFEAGIESYLFLIIGFPGETVADFVETLLFVFEFQPYAVFGHPTLMRVIPNRPIARDCRKFGLLTRGESDWVSADLRNDLGVRLFKGFVLGSAVFNGYLSTNSLLAWKELRDLDVNRFPVASEIASILYELWKVSGVEDQKCSVLEHWEGHARSEPEISPALVDHWHPPNIPRSMQLRRWFSVDKNSEESKRAICKHVLEGLRAVRQIAANRQHGELP